ncbi:MAG TPA: LytTR family DNA-binding domain-containing protein [Candidatus Sulfotelmatobacter sp.]|jgi:two-component system LytT family response regulator|nr:LytTR family DNA-binding domain-containing protein [Candidatus Sulfotelmatobacter sp.]
MSLRVAIVDDEKPARDRLRRMLASIPDLTVVGEAGDVASAVELTDREKPDLLLLDVQMPGGDGFEVLRRVARLPLVVFITAFDHYAVRAFEVKSLDYLLKPVPKDRLAEAVERARRAADGGRTPPADMMRLLEEIRAGLPAAVEAATARPAPSRIPAKRGAKILLLDPADVIWFESEGELVHARTADARALVERSLGELEELLAGSFFRIHRSYLVNLSRIGAIVPEDGGTYRVVMKDESLTPLPLSRRQAQKLREIIPW